MLSKNKRESFVWFCLIPSTIQDDFRVNHALSTKCQRTKNIENSILTPTRG